LSPAQLKISGSWQGAGFRHNIMITMGRAKGPWNCSVELSDATLVAGAALELRSKLPV
jgi:hypothetical protein